MKTVKLKLSRDALAVFREKADTGFDRKFDNQISWVTNEELMSVISDYETMTKALASAKVEVSFGKDVGKPRRRVRLK